MEKDTILVTGGFGYIGSNMCLMLKDTYNVIVIDNMCNGTTVARNRLLSEGIICYTEDLNNESELDNIFRSHNIKTVIHFASLKSIQDSINDPVNYYYNNISSLIILLKIMERHGCLNIIFSSSATVYGQIQQNVTENTKKEFNNTPYGLTKCVCEELLKNFSTYKKLNVIILRYFNPIGNIDNGIVNKVSCNPISFIEHLIYSIKTKQTFYIYGNDHNTVDGTCERDFIHLEDLLLGHMKALTKILEIDDLKIVNLGTGKPCSVLQFINTFEKVHNIKIDYEFIESRPQEISSSYCNADYAKEFLNWSSKYDIYDICKSIEI